MKRTARAWPVFAAALLLSAAVMLFFSVKVLQLERSIADAQARAALEESVRLALWRMDSAATLLLARKDAPSALPGNRNEPPPGAAQKQRLIDPQFQTARNINELRQREDLSALANVQTLTTGADVEPAPAADWRDLAPALIDRISDILPGAKLEEAPSDSTDAPDPRRLATIPARLVVPDSALPDSSLPWHTPLRISLMVAWACFLLAASAVGLVLSATLDLSRRRAAFASAVTHELRTPLTTFRMYAEMLATGVVADPTARRDYLQTLVTESDRLAHLIENVLANSRLENRPLPRALETLPVDQVLEHALPALHRRAEQAGVALTVDLPDDARATRVRTDPVAVQQILLNLVDNACKHARTDVALSARALPSAVELTVADQGPGLRCAANHAFSAFNKSRTDTVPGIGLGLYLSRQLARAFGGELAHRPTDLGAAFTLTLPREP